jgi:hypothetical protein
MLNKQSKSHTSNFNKFRYKNVILIIVKISLLIVVLSSLVIGVNGSLRQDEEHPVKINKCCEKFEIMIDNRCTDAREINASKFFFLFPVPSKNEKKIRFETISP